MSTPTIPLTDMTQTEVETAVSLQPSPWLIALRSFTNGVTAAVIVVSALMGLEVSLGVPRIIGAAVMGFLGFAILFAGEGLAILLWKMLALLCRLTRFTWGAQALQTIPPVPVGRIFGAFIYIAGDLLWPDSFFQSIVLPVAGEIAILLTGLTVMLVTLARLNGRSRPAQYALVGIPALLILAFAICVFNPGFSGYVAALPETPPAPTLSLADPGQPGPYSVKTLSYGSGTDGRRPEYGAEASLITPVVDGSRIFSGYSGLVSTYFRWYWGFDFSQLPLNGLVWYPDSAETLSAGPFPLILIVHGNHAMSEYSEPGYAYLGEHLASQGYIAVSVDENFLNGLLFFDGKFEEMPLRAWLLLQHLRQWQSWNETPGNPFNGKVDLERVALIGHSRGGEAVAWAEHLNRRSMEPVTAVSPITDFGFGIRGVVSIAPSDAYAGPFGLRPTLDQSSYLLLAGGHDADTFILYGQQQYNRIRLDEKSHNFKALAYVYQANHGQFNSVWGNKDRGLYNSLLLNRAPLLSGAEQEQAAKVLITSFLNAALRDEAAFRAVFANPAVAADWLPPGIVATQLQEASFIPVDTNSGSATLTATEVAGAKATAAGTAVARVVALKLRDDETNQGNKALHLAWDAGMQPGYTITLPPEKAAGWGLSPEHSLTFALASVPGAAVAEAVWVELETAVGQTVRLPLSDFGPILPPLPAHLVKASWLAGLNGFPGKVRPEEVVLQTYTLPLSAFQAVNPAFRPEQISAIRFHFAGETAGAVYLGEIGFIPAKTSDD